jgi:hypothetical protein
MPEEDDGLALFGDALFLEIQAMGIMLLVLLFWRPICIFLACNQFMHIQPILYNLPTIDKIVFVCPLSRLLFILGDPCLHMPMNQSLPRGIKTNVNEPELIHKLGRLLPWPMAERAIIPFKYDDADRRCYCDVVFHGILHCVIKTRRKERLCLWAQRFSQLLNQR